MTLHEGTYVVFFYHDKLRSGHVDKVRSSGITLKLDNPGPNEKQYKSFRYDKIRNLVTQAIWANLPD